MKKAPAGALPKRRGVRRTYQGSVAAVATTVATAAAATTTAAIA